MEALDVCYNLQCKIVEASSVLHRKNILLFVIMRSEAQTLFESMTDEEMCTAAESILFFCITIFWETWMPCSFFHSSNYKSLKFAITVFMRCRNSKVWLTAVELQTNVREIFTITEKSSQLWQEETQEGSLKTVSVGFVYIEVPLFWCLESESYSFKLHHGLLCSQTKHKK